MKTRALIYGAKEQVEVREIEIPELGPEEVLVRAQCSGVSVGTDGWILTNRFTWAGDIPYPVVPGYQRAGWVEALGSEVKNLKVGQRVAATISRLEGKPVANWGGHLHYGVNSQSEVYPLSDRISLVNAAQVIVAQVGYNAATRSGVQAGQTVLVLGDGCIGQMAAQAARARGARVIIAGHRKERLELASKHSADEILQTQDPAWIKRLQSEESPVSIVIDTVQDAAFFEQYRHHLRAEATIVLSGFSSAGFQVDMGELQKTGLSVLTVCGWSRQRNEATLALMAEGKMNFEGLMTHQVPIAEAPKTWAMMLAKSEPFLGVNFLWE
jgi:bacteriochlorophyllide a dehydrogenase